MNIRESHDNIVQTGREMLIIKHYPYEKGYNLFLNSEEQTQQNFKLKLHTACSHAR
jgi:hypothetical protein